MALPTTTASAARLPARVAAAPTHLHASHVVSQRLQRLVQPALDRLQVLQGVGTSCVNTPCPAIVVNTPFPAVVMNTPIVPSHARGNRCCRRRARAAVAGSCLQLMQQPLAVTRPYTGTVWHAAGQASPTCTRSRRAAASPATPPSAVSVCSSSAPSPGQPCMPCLAGAPLPG